ncbi:hypothetical protein GQ43DRAFT_143377 [Delitschia confertaspora ATCC 74209]|uniref:BZIP domain-containing protein n=1 Tax=Delitschia confertaspora ATCC 74209 TaxID=1513339 RepID=A0A9P4JIB2_9PLEO|nr:hypothetical protein GQ43DRAFT_143377 [Delitschia confertaspora ATCC 74209]
MSRTGASGSQSVVTEDASHRIVQHTAPQPSPNTSQPAMRSALAGKAREGPASSTSLPPLRYTNTPPTPSSERRSGNPLGVQSILNPQNDQLEQLHRRRSGTHIESPSPIESHPPSSLPSISRPTSVDSTQEDHALNRRFPGPGRVHARHLLNPNPRSPKVHHTPSLGVLNPPTGTIDAHQSPFLSPSTRPFGLEGVTTHPALPTPPPMVRPGYFAVAPSTVPTPPPGMARNDLRRASTGFPPSGSASPMTSYSPYSQPASAASSQYEPSGSSRPSSYIHVPGSTQSQETNSAASVENERSLIPMTSSGSQHTYQLMDYISRAGQNMQIPVDVRAASKDANEKRKRNAGASARFRARRKEKELQASTTIQNLQQQLREADEDVEYYRSERNYFRSIAFQQPGAERIITRPASPRLRRVSTQSMAPTSIKTEGSGSSYSGYSEMSDAREPERNVRRRTSSYHPPAGPNASTVNGSGGQHQAFSTSTFCSANSGPPAQSQAQADQRNPAHQYEAHDQRPLPEMHQPPPQRPVLRDPFANGTGRYENRN